jgi:hypothetical protein
MTKRLFLLFLLFPYFLERKVILLQPLLFALSPLSLVDFGVFVRLGDTEGTQEGAILIDGLQMAGWRQRPRNLAHPMERLRDHLMVRHLAHPMEGGTEGASDGEKLGSSDGKTEGASDGEKLGSSDGKTEGASDGETLGSSNGSTETVAALPPTSSLPFQPSLLLQHLVQKRVQFCIISTKYKHIQLKMLPRSRQLLQCQWPPSPKPPILYGRTHLASC